MLTRIDKITLEQINQLDFFQLQAYPTPELWQAKKNWDDLLANRLSAEKKKQYAKFTFAEILNVEIRLKLIDAFYKSLSAIAIQEEIFQVLILLANYWPVNAVEEKKLLCPIAYDKIPRADKTFLISGHHVTKSALLKFWQSKDCYGELNNRRHPCFREPLVSQREADYIKPPTLPTLIESQVQIRARFLTNINSRLESSREVGEKITVGMAISMFAIVCVVAILTVTAPIITLATAALFSGITYTLGRGIMAFNNLAMRNATLKEADKFYQNSYETPKREFFSISRRNGLINAMREKIDKLRNTEKNSASAIQPTPASTKTAEKKSVTDKKMITRSYGTFGTFGSSGLSSGSSSEFSHTELVRKSMKL